jgi:hypothetical protein
MAKPSRFEGWSALDLAIVHDPAIATARGYVNFFRDGYKGHLHTWLWEQLVGPIPPGYQIDHINGIRYDCRLENMRCVPPKINSRNVKKNPLNTSGSAGVMRMYTLGHYYWVATWRDPITGKHVRKCFNTSKMPEKEAKQKAIDHRALVMQDLIANHGYTARHGT